MRVLDADAVRRALPMADAIAAVKEAYAAVSSGRARVPLRTHLELERREGLALVMPAYVDSGNHDPFTVKVATIFDGNTARGLARIQASVLVFDSETGAVRAILEGATLTALRTGASCGAATDLLAREDSRVVALIGAGVQARASLEAICTVRSIETVYVCSRTPERVAELIADCAGQGPIPADVRRVETAGEAVRQADVVCAATTSSKPVFDSRDLKPGAHINGVGSYQPNMQELPEALITSSRVFVDEREAALHEAGDLTQPIERGVFSADRIAGELGEVILATCPGRTAADEWTTFKSVGLGAQDACASMAALKRAERDHLGTEVAF